MQFIFPADPLSSRVSLRMDEFFKPQAVELSPTGFASALFSVEEGRVQRVVAGQTVMYRGWMLKAEEYLKLSEKVEAEGAMLYTSIDQYLNTHHIPNWYQQLSEYTADTIVFTNKWMETADLKAAFEQLKSRGWGTFFLKDYVKSLNTTRAKGSVCDSADEALECIELMKKYRGGLEGGLCIRRFEELNDERRYFILNGEVGSGFRPADEEVLRAAAHRIDSPFFSVDVAYDAAGRTRIVEIGDGQVSDLKGWTAKTFGHMFQKLFA